MSWNFDESVNREGTDSVKYDLRKNIFGVEDVIPMWVADMDFKAPDFIVNALQKRLDHNIYGYSFRSYKYYQSVVEWFSSRYKWKIQKDWLCFSPGVVPSLNVCIQAFTRPGEGIIIQPPVYFPFITSVESNGRRLIINKLKESEGKWIMDLESLSASIDDNTKMIILCNPHNPVGRAWRPDELRSLAQICLERNIIILSDEIHCDLVLPGFLHTPVASLSEKIADITITCVAPSKTFNLAGLSTSSAIISNPVLRKYFNKKIADMDIGNGNIFGAVASAAAYSEGEEWLNALIDYVQANIDYVTGYFRENIPEIIPVVPEATYMIWLDCRSLGLTGKELQDFFVQKAKVGLVEGSKFGPGGEGFMRMNLATPCHLVEKAMDQIGKSMPYLRKNIK